MILENRTRTARLSVESIAMDCPPAGLLDELVSHDNPVLLESAALHDTYGRYSILTCCPVDVLTLHEHRLTDCQDNVLAQTQEGIWEILGCAFSCFPSSIRNPESQIRSPYTPGWFGYLGYELSQYIERLPARARRDVDLPDLRLGFYDAVLIYDAVERVWSLVELVCDPPLPNAGRTAGVLRDLVSSPANAVEEDHPALIEYTDARIRPTDRPLVDFTPNQYRRAIANCVEYITAGDIFQVALSQRFTVPDAPDPLSIYHALRRRSPGWYAGYLGFEFKDRPITVLSSSPELFLRVRGNNVVTRPIKGTRPRVGIEAHDQAAAAELLASEKDNAELAMIVDLLRNDLGRVCSFGTIRVTEPRRLETHPTVFHLVATVEGHLDAKAGIAELIRATFPGGSVTGAPKIRAMEIIDQLEPVTRGVYTGCVGTAGVTGCAEWNIAIRTLICEGGRAHIHSGGGIVADSIPQLEYAETLDKARAMLEAVTLARQTVKY